MPTTWGDRRKGRSKRKKRTSAINGTTAAVDREEERDAKKRSLGSPEKPEEEVAVSSAPSSPICEPYIPDDEAYSVELYQAFEPLQQKFEEKIGRQMQMPTLDNFVPTYYQAHYDIALFRVIVDRPLPLPSFNDRVQSAQEVFRLGRDENLGLRITHGRVEHLNPNLFQRYHFMFCLSDTDVDKYDDGGLIIDLDGKVVGMVNITSKGSFIPSSILLKCLDLWKKFGYIPRPHLGFKFLAIKLLDPLYIDKIWRKYNMDDGLIVNEVADGSNGEMLGIRRGDIISCFNGEKISSTFELENLLLDICMEFDRANQPNAKVDVLIKVFNTRKSRWREFHLTANVSDHGEVVARATLPFTLR